MKSKKEIIARAVILNALSDRCAVEEEWLGKTFHSLQEREEQRGRIFRWLKGKGYEEYMTERERSIFQLPVSDKKNESILLEEYQCKAIEVFLWVLGLLEQITDYSHFVLDDYHTILGINKDHKLEVLEKACQLRTEFDVALQTEVAMLWHWRTIEIGNVPKNGRSWGDCITMIFGEEYEKMLSYIPQAKETPCDFLVGGKPVADLNETEQRMLDIIAYWRHHAFEWIMGDDAWDEVSADT